MGVFFIYMAYRIPFIFNTFRGKVLIGNSLIEQTVRNQNPNK